jgi:hypothetical protein
MRRRRRRRRRRKEAGILRIGETIVIAFKKTTKAQYIIFLIMFSSSLGPLTTSANTAHTRAATRRCFIAAAKDS